MPERIEITCTPSELLKTYKCFKCLSKLELMQVIVLSMAEISGAYTLPDDLGKLMSDSACWTCVSDTQLLQMVASMLAQLAFSGTEITLEEVRDKIACLLCANPAQVKGAAAKLFCTLCQQSITPN